MLLRLTLNVSNQPVQVRRTDAEGAVLDLPAEEPVLRKGIMDPFGGAALEQLHRFGNRQRRGQCQQKMDRVRHATNFDGPHLILPSDAAQIRPEPFLKAGRDQRPSFLGAEDAMITADVGHAPQSAVPSGLMQHPTGAPNVETLGYCHLSLRDEAVKATSSQKPGSAGAPPPPSESDCSSGNRRAPASPFSGTPRPASSENRAGPHHPESSSGGGCPGS